MMLVVIVQAGQTLLVAVCPSAQVDLDRIVAAGLSFSKVDILEIAILSQLFTGNGLSRWIRVALGLEICRTSLVGEGLRKARRTREASGARIFGGDGWSCQQ